MPLTTSQRIKILRYLELPYTTENKTLVWGACDVVESESDDLVAECIGILTLFDATIEKEQQAFVDQGGMTKADVIEWDPAYVCKHIRGQKSRYRRQLASLLNLLEYIPSAVENIF
jgi:hypothetical protein